MGWVSKWRGEMKMYQNVNNAADRISDSQYRKLSVSDKCNYIRLNRITSIVPEKRERLKY
jgi:hypothetical protein